MLLVDHGQCQVGKAFGALKQGMGAHRHQGVAGREAITSFPAVPLGCSSGVQRHGDSQRRQPIGEVQIVLLGEQFRRCHHGRLAIVLGRADGGECCHHGLARADVALDQPQHRLGFLEIEQHLGNDAPLGGGQLEFQPIAKLAAELLAAGQRPGSFGGTRPLPAFHDQNAGEQFIQCRAFPSRSEAGGGGFYSRAMQITQRIGEIREGRIVEEIAQIRRSPVVETPKRLIHETCDASLAEAFRGRVDRRQHRFGRVRPSRERSILRMHQLQPVGPHADLSEAAQKHTCLQAGLLTFAEMEKPERQETGAIGQGDEPAAAPAVGNLRIEHLAGNQTFLAGYCLRQGDNPGSVLISGRKVQQQILDAVDVEGRQPGCDGWPDPTQRGYAVIDSWRFSHASGGI